MSTSLDAPCGAPAAAAPAPCAPPLGSEPLPGSVVELCGLVTVPELNGHLGLVCVPPGSDDAAAHAPALLKRPENAAKSASEGRLAVRLLDAGDAQYTIKALRPSNLTTPRRPVPPAISANFLALVQNRTVLERSIRSCEAARLLIESARTVTVLTGAGISTDSGIPDFRGPNGLWTKDPAAAAASTIQMFVTSREARLSSWSLVPMMYGALRPNPGHLAINALRRSGKLQLLVTQNIDGLHQEAGHPEDSIAEVHGSFTRVQCLYCLQKYPMRAVFAEYQPALGSDGCPMGEPRCPRCSGMMKPDVVLFGEALPSEVVSRSFKAASSCDVLVCIGTSLTVSPVNNMVRIAKQAGAKVVIVNGSPTAMNDVADLFVDTSISLGLPLLLGYDEALDGAQGAGSISSEGREAETNARFGGFTSTLPAEHLARMDAEVAEAWKGGPAPKIPLGGVVAGELAPPGGVSATVV